MWRRINHIIIYLTLKHHSTHKSVYKYSYIHDLNEISHLGPQHSLSPRAKDHLTETPTPLLSCWPRFSMRLPKHYKLWLLSLVPSQKWKISPYCKDTIHFRHRTSRPLSRTDLELKASSLRTIFQGPRRHYARREATTVLPAMMPTNHNNGHHGTITLRVQ